MIRTRAGSSDLLVEFSSSILTTFGEALFAMAIIRLIFERVASHETRPVPLHLRQAVVPGRLAGTGGVRCGKTKRRGRPAESGIGMGLHDPAGGGRVRAWGAPPLEPLALAEAQRVRLTISDPGSGQSQRDLKLVEWARAEIAARQAVPTIEEVRQLLASISWNPFARCNPPTAGIIDWRNIFRQPARPSSIITQKQGRQQFPPSSQSPARSSESPV